MNTQFSPSISVVIPTVGRATLVRAVNSALDQTSPVQEVIVCNDSDETLPLPDDRRIKVINVGPRRGGNAARNAGVAAARGEWIALLDDDDYWAPDHIEGLQVALANRDLPEFWIVSDFGSLDSGRSFPQRVRREGENVLAYVFLLRWWRKGAIPTSTLMAPRAGFVRVPWRPDYRFHQDVTWLIDLFREFGDFPTFQSPSIGVTFGNTQNSITKSIPPADSARWAKEHLLKEPKQGRFLYGDFLLSRYPLRAAASSGQWIECWRIAREAALRGRPSLSAWSYALIFILREGARAASRRVGRS